MRENRVFLCALFLSSALHLCLLFAPTADALRFDKVETKPLTVRMETFALETPTPAPEAAQTALPPKSNPEPDAPKSPRAENPPVPAAPKITATEDDATPTATEDDADRPTEQNPGHETVIVRREEGWDEPEEASQPYAQTIDDTPAPAPASPQIIAESPYDIIAPPDDARPPFPHRAQLRYQGPLGITADMNFERGDGRYLIEATFNIPFNKMIFRSEGLIVGNKFIPQHYRDIRDGKIYASADFDFEAGVIRFGKGDEPSQEIPLTGAAHDFFSWAWQMSVDGGCIPDNILLTNGKKVYVQESLPCEQLETEETLYDTGEGKLRVVNQKIDRHEKSGDDTVAYGFAPDFANIPATIVFRDKGREYGVKLIAVTLDDHVYWKAVRPVVGKKSAY